MINERVKLGNMGLTDVKYSPNKHIGQQSIDKLMKETCESFNLKCTSHGLCALSISTVINAVANAKEMLGFSRHKSAAAQIPYHHANHASEMAKFKALRFLEDPRFDTYVVVGNRPPSVIVHAGNEEEKESQPAAAAAKP